MNILFDQGTPVPLRNQLSGHSIDTAYENGWSDITNSELLDQAENAGYDLLITTDQNLFHQQNLSSRKIAILVLTSASWPKIRQNTKRIKKTIREIDTGDYEEINISETPDP